MSLPNYFLADLPTEAELTPAILTGACETLKRNREKYLVHRHTSEIVSVLCEVGQAWLQPENKFRRMALGSAGDANGDQRAGAETGAPRGFSAATMARGFDGFFRRFTPENFETLLKQELGEGLPDIDPREAARHASLVSRHFCHGPELLVHIAAGNIPNPALMSLTLGLLTRSAQFMKCASGASLLPRLFAHSIYDADPKLGSCLELAEWLGGNRGWKALCLPKPSV